MFVHNWEAVSITNTNCHGALTEHVVNGFEGYKLCVHMCTFCWQALKCMQYIYETLHILYSLERLQYMQNTKMFTNCSALLMASLFRQGNLSRKAAFILLTVQNPHTICLIGYGTIGKSYCMLGIIWWYLTWFANQMAAKYFVYAKRS